MDIPSGMICHGITEGEVIRADEVLSFEFVKLAFLLPENKFRIKNWTLKSIGLDQEAIKKENTLFTSTPKRTSVLSCGKEIGFPIKFIWSRTGHRR
ncbi:MAG: hypothetical protein IPG87_15815 [Saprospiraceae bacterium]|nr:hypothetical protein [Candidatus Vicinibacter affinis]